MHLLRCVSALVLSSASANAAFFDLTLISTTPGVHGKTVTASQYDGASLGGDAYDVHFLASPSPAFDLYATNSVLGFNAREDTRAPGDLNPWHISLDGRALTPTANGTMSITYDNDDGAFDGLSFTLDVYDANHNWLAGVDPVLYAENNWTLNFSDVHNGKTFELVLTPVPEPSTLCLLGASVVFLTAHSIRQKRSARNTGCNLSRQACKGLDAV